MSKKLLHSRLKNLFDSFEETETSVPQVTEPVLPGWSWETDLAGNFIVCSHQVENMLGIPSAEFLDHSLFEFALPPSGKEILKTAFQAAVYPVESTLSYFMADHTELPVRITIHQRVDAADKPVGLYGFTQVLTAGVFPIFVEPIHEPTPLIRPAAHLAEPIISPPTHPNPALASEAKVGTGLAPLTPIGERSLQSLQPVFEKSSAEAPAAMAVPIKLRQEVLGVLEVIDQTTNKNWSEDERQLVVEVVNQLSLALENAQLYGAVQQELKERIRAEQEILRRNQDLATLNRIGQELAKITDPGDLFDIVTELVGLVIDNQNLIIALHDGVSNTLSFPAYVVDGKKQVFSSRPFGSNGIIDHVLLSREPLLIVENAISALRRRGINPIGKVPQSILAVPMLSGGNAVGVVLCQNFTKQHAYSNIQLDLLSTISSQATIALQNARLVEDTQRRALELQTAAEIARDTTGTLTLSELFNRVVNMLCARFGFYHAGIFLVDSSGIYAVVGEATGEAGSLMKKQEYKVPISPNTLIGSVILKAEPQVVNDSNNSKLYVPNPLLPESRSELVIPLKLDQSVIGVLDVHSASLNAFGQDEVSVLQILADQIAVAIENARAYEISQDAVRDMQEADRIKNQFLANMSHELRTPLNSIIGFSRVILKGIDGPVNELQEQDLTAIYNSGQHLLSLITDILDMSRIDAGKMELNMDDVNIPDLIQSVMSTAIGLVKDKPIKLVKEVDPTIPLVRADPTRVRQVLLNLISNAAKFTEEGAITVTGGVQNNPLGNPEVLISVIDNGPGISPEDQVKLFQRFSQVDDSPTRRTGGTGLGLSISRSLIDLHKGRIGVHSEVGKGSTFWFSIPLPRDELPEVPDSPQPVILCIDDDLQVIQLYQRYLSNTGYQVLAVTEASQAMRAVKEIQPAVITLDVMMPTKDGWSILSELKSDPQTRDIPIIMCTILEEDDKGFSMGAAEYLIKPILQDDLVNALNHLNIDGSIHEILVIDDDPDDLRLVKKTLEDTGKFQVTTAENGEAGWDQISERKPNALILDLFMPGLDGFSILDRIRSNANLQDLPVVILTGADLTPEQHQQMAQFGNTMLSKALVKGEDLLASVETAIHRWRPAPDSK